MTSKSLFNNTTKYPPLPSGSLKHYHWLALVSLIAVGLTTTVPIFMFMVEKFQDARYSSNTFNILRGNSLLWSVSILLAFVNGLTMFKYLNQKDEVDFYHSLPVSLKDMFWCRYFMGIVYFAIPLAINGCLSYSFSIFSLLDGTPLLGDFIRQWFVLLCNFISVYSLVCFATVITGNIFMAVATAVGFACTCVTLVYVFFVLCGEFYKTYVFSDEIIGEVLYHTNPLWFYTYLHNFFEVSFASLVLVLLAQTLFFVTCAYVFYKKRPKEQVGIPVAVRPFKLVIKSLGVVCGSALGGVIFMLIINNSIVNFLLGSVILGVVLHIVFEMLLEQDIRAGLGNKHHCCVLVGVVFVTAVVISLDLTKYDEKLSPLERISAITWDGIRVEEPENIQIIHNMIQETIENDYVLDDEQIQMVATAKVMLENGTSYSRFYYSTSLRLADHVALTTSKEYVFQSHNYKRFIEDFAVIDQIEDMKSSNINRWIHIYYNNFDSKDYYTAPSTLQWEEFKWVFESAYAQFNQLTPEFLCANIPVVTIEVYGSEYGSLQLPLYYIHEEALAMLDLPDLGLEERAKEFYGLAVPSNTVGFDSVEFATLSEATQDAIFQNMIPIYRNGNQYYEISGYDYTNIVRLYYNNQLVGYLSLSEYEDLVEEYS